MEVSSTNTQYNVGPLNNIDGTVILTSVYVVCSNGSGKCNDGFNILFGDNPTNNSL